MIWIQFAAEAPVGEPRLRGAIPLTSVARKSSDDDHECCHDA